MSLHSLGDHTLPADLLDPSLRWHSLCYNNVRHILYIYSNDALFGVRHCIFGRFSAFTTNMWSFYIYKNVVFDHINDKKVLK